jgi:arylformamidase
LSYTQDELNRAFDQTQWAPNMMQVVGSWGDISRGVREHASGMQARRYGDGFNEDLEIFPAAAPNAPVYIFMHGGEWKRRDNLSGAFPALSLVHAGFTYVNLNFEALPHVRLPHIVDQVRRAVVWVYNNARDYGANPGAIHLFGHSSGAHLAAVLATTRWQDFGVPADVLKSVSCVSGLYDMEPVMLSMRREWVKLTPEEGRELSPVHDVSNVNCPVSIVYGENESPEFKRQARVFHEVLLVAKKQSRLISVADRNHFELLDTLREPGSELEKLLVNSRF